MHLRQSTRIPKSVAECAVALPQAVAEVAWEKRRVGFTIGPASLRTNYQPPLGRLGKAVDDAAMHNVARATVKDFLGAVRARVLEEA